MELLKKNKFDVFFLLLLSILLIYDFFPGLRNFIYIPTWLIGTLIVLILIISIWFPRFSENTPQESYRMQIFVVVYILSIIFLLMFLGGESVSGLFNGFGIWVALLINIFEILKKRKDVIEGENKAL